MCIDGGGPGSVKPGTLVGDTTIQIPRRISVGATARESHIPCGSTFSPKITPAMTAIHITLITPSANRTTIRPKEQPTQ